MGHVIVDLPPADIDRLEGLWQELLDHHLAAAPHLAALGAARDPADSWRVRRAQYRQWLAVPKAAVLVARDADRLLGYAMIRSADAAGSWQWACDEWEAICLRQIRTAVFRCCSTQPVACPLAPGLGAGMLVPA